jgi:hypothetical protein
LTAGTGRRVVRLSSTGPGGKGERMNETPLFTERHYTVDEVADMWNLSRDSVRRLFLSEPDVPKIARAGSRKKRPYVTLRIPESVLNRVYGRMCARRVG